MRLVSKLIGLLVLAGCVGPTPPPPPDYALRVIDAETVAFAAAFRGESAEQALEGALDALGWDVRRAPGSVWTCRAAGLDVDCRLEGEGEGREVLLVLLARAPTASLEERGRLLAAALRDRERGR